MLSQAQRTTILELQAQGVSKREIARVLGISRVAVRSVLRLNSSVVTMSDLTDGLGRKRDCLRDARRRDAISKLADNGAEDDTHLLNAPSQQLNNLS